MSASTTVYGSTVLLQWAYPSTVTVSGVVYNFVHVNITFDGVSTTSLPNNSSQSRSAGYNHYTPYTVIAVYVKSGHPNQNVTDSGSVTTGPPPGVTPGTPTISGYDGGGGVVYLSWGATSDADHYTVRSVSHGTFDTSGTSYSYNIGYSTSDEFWVAAISADGTASGPSNHVTVTTGAAPGGGGGGSAPAAPSAATLLVVTPTGGGGFGLSWTGASGGATGYEVRRNGTVISTTAGTTYTDTTPGPVLPVTYAVYAYNSNGFGTTYGAGSNTVTVGVGDSAGILAC